MAEWHRSTSSGGRLAPVSPDNPHRRFPQAALMVSLGYSASISELHAMFGVMASIRWSSMAADSWIPPP